MPILPIPVQGYLVPEQKLLVPEGFTPVDEPILNGLPHTIQLGEDTTLVVVIPTGLAATWRDIDPTTVVSSSADERQRFNPAESTSAAMRASARILMRVGGRTVASLPLVAKLLRTIPGDGERGVQIELLIVSWDLRAGNLRGPGDFGSRIVLATRRADQANDQFSTPPVNQYLIPRLGDEFRTQSELGRKALRPLQRFETKKAGHL